MLLTLGVLNKALYIIKRQLFAKTITLPQKRMTHTSLENIGSIIHVKRNKRYSYYRFRRFST